jgi:hypothetical protein
MLFSEILHLGKFPDCVPTRRQDEAGRVGAENKSMDAAADGDENILAHDCCYVYRGRLPK